MQPLLSPWSAVKVTLVGLKQKPLINFPSKESAKVMKTTWNLASMKANCLKVMKLQFLHHRVQLLADSWFQTDSHTSLLPLATIRKQGML